MFTVLEKAKNMPCRKRTASSTPYTSVRPYSIVHSAIPPVAPIRRSFLFSRSLMMPVKGRATMEAMEKAPVMAPATAMLSPMLPRYFAIIVETME